MGRMSVRDRLEQSYRDTVVQQINISIFRNEECVGEVCGRPTKVADLLPNQYKYKNIYSHVYTICQIGYRDLGRSMVREVNGLKYVFTLVNHEG